MELVRLAVKLQNMGKKQRNSTNATQFNIAQKKNLYCCSIIDKYSFKTTHSIPHVSTLSLFGHTEALQWVALTVRQGVPRS